VSELSSEVAPELCREVYARFVAGESPAGIAAMQALAAAPSAEAARAVLPPAAGALKPLLTEAAHALVGEMLALASPDEETSPEAWGAIFDAAARISPEGSVALYSLGDAERLAAATTEVVDWLRSERLVRPDRRVLEVGCGIGRFLTALAPGTTLMVGVDVSAVMCAEAARRCAGVSRAAVVRTGGRDLSPFQDRSFDLVLFVDSFPYVVNAGLADAMVAEAARVLRPGGDLLVINWSYRGDAARDAADAAALASANGLDLVATPAPSLTLWDGAVHRLRKPC
jgi:SAM-dependent methyltransferase